MVRETVIIAMFVILIIIIAIVLPVGFGSIFNANVTGWNSNTEKVFSFIPIILVVAVAIIIAFIFLEVGGDSETREPIKTKKEYIQPDLRELYQHNKVLPRHKHHIKTLLIFIIRRWLNE